MFIMEELEINITRWCTELVEKKLYAYGLVLPLHLTLRTENAMLPKAQACIFSALFQNNR